jgi:hypothetical protein
MNTGADTMTRNTNTGRTAGLLLAARCVFAAGYLAGQGAFRFGGNSAQAQEDAAAAPAAGSTLSDETRAKIKAAADAMNAAVESLKLDQQWFPATKGINTFGVLTGGLNSMKDLEEGRGVDPETFAALYAGLAADEIADKIGRDPEGRVTFNGRLVRMYPVSRLKSLYGSRAANTGEEISAELDGKKPTKKKEEAEPESN